MIPVIAVLAVATVLGVRTVASNSNKFEATTGCLQYSSDQGYDYPHPYFSTGTFRNVRKGPNNASEFRFGILGNNDGILRLAPVQFPYDQTRMNEIVLSGWAGTQTVVRRYVRTSPSNRTDLAHLVTQSGIGMLSKFEPLMFTLTVNPNGSAKLTKDGDTYPFLEFRDATLSTKYIGFCNYDVPVIFFYDCPHVWY